MVELLIVVVALYLGWRSIRWFVGIFRDPAEPTANSRGEVVVGEVREWTPPTRPEYRITYVDKKGTATERDIAVLSSSYREMPRYIKAWCFLRQDKRKFFDDQIVEAVNLETGRKVKSVHAHTNRAL